MTFEEWFKREFTYVNASYEGSLQVIEDYMKEAWDYQQKNIDLLQEYLADIGEAEHFLRWAEMNKRDDEEE